MSRLNEWSPLNRSATRLVNQWADMKHLVAFLGPKITETARYIPSKGEIEANTDLIFKGMRPRRVIKKGLEKFHHFPIAIGALYHEAMHAKYTPAFSAYGDLSALEPRVRSVLFSLEEPRIEGRGVRQDKTMQPYLRASGLRVALDDGEDTPLDAAAKAIQGIIAPHDESKKGPSNDFMPCILGRVIAGVLTEDDVEKVREAYTELLGADVMKKADGIMREFIGLDKSETKRMIQLAEQWCREIPEDEQDPDDELQEMLDELAKAIQGAASRAGSGAGKDIDEQRRAEEKAEEAAKKADERKREQAAEKAGRDQEHRSPQDAFGDRREMFIGHGYGSHYDTPFNERFPTAEEKRAATRLAKQLQKAEYSDKIRTHVGMMIPPGKVKMRNAVSNRGAKAAGGISSLPEYEMLKRIQTVSPTLRVGVIVDVSGSMSGAMSPMAATNYVLSAALEKIGASYSQVYMGTKAYLDRRKGKTRTVQVWNANANGENFQEASAILDNVQRFSLDEDGARLLVIVSDGQFWLPGAKQAADRYLRLMQDQGATVLWLGYGNTDDGADELCKRNGAHFVRFTGGESVTEAAEMIGREAVKALLAKKVTAI